MKEVREAAYYDHIYEKSVAYQSPYLTVIHFPVFASVMQFIKIIGVYPVIELGCGTGQLAEYLYNEGIKNYVGVDFSRSGLKMARVMSKQDFMEYDIREGMAGILKAKGWEEEPNIIVVAIEVFEHVADDLKIIREIPAGSELIWSVPNFDSEGHVRFFETDAIARERYEGVVKIENQIGIANRWVMRGQVKSKLEQSAGKEVEKTNGIYGRECKIQPVDF